MQASYTRGMSLYTLLGVHPVVELPRTTSIMPKWRNGRRCGLKIHWQVCGEGPNPFLGTNIAICRCKHSMVLRRIANPFYLIGSVCSNRTICAIHRGVAKYGSRHRTLTPAYVVGSNPTTSANTLTRP